MATIDNITLVNNFGEQTQNQIVAQPGGLIMSLPGAGNIYGGVGAPSFAAPAGSLYLRTDGAASTCMYVNPTLGNHWAAVTAS